MFPIIKEKQKRIDFMVLRLMRLSYVDKKLKFKVKLKDLKKIGAMG